MKKLIIIDNTHEYDYELTDKTHTLYYNNSDNWSDHTKGTIAMSITDDDDELKVNTSIKKLDCMKALYLTILLKIIHGDYKFEIAEKIEF